MTAFITIEDLKLALDMFLRGGAVMYMLAVVAGLLYTMGLAALIYVIRGNLNVKNVSQWSGWIRQPDLAEGRIGEAIVYALHGPRVGVKTVRRRFDEMRSTILASIDRRLLVVNMLVAAAPLTGLLGTVAGMLGMFAGLSGGTGGSSMDRVARGMFEALITTQTGLTIALPGLFLVLVIKQRRNRIEIAMARLESLILTTRFTASSAS